MTGETTEWSEPKKVKSEANGEAEYSITLRKQNGVLEAAGRQVSE